MSFAKNSTSQGEIFQSRKSENNQAQKPSETSLEQVREILMGENLRRTQEDLERLSEQIQSLREAQKHSISVLGKKFMEALEEQRVASSQNRNTDAKELQKIKQHFENVNTKFENSISSLRSTNVTKIQMSSFLRSWAETFDSPEKENHERA